MGPLAAKSWRRVWARKTMDEDNLKEMLKLWCEDSNDLAKWLQKKSIGPRTTCKMKLLKSWLILFRNVSCTTWRRTSIFRVMLTSLRTPASKTKWVKVVHEDLVGRYKIGNTNTEKVIKVNKESVCRLGLDLDDCRGQGYHEACNIKGRLSGVQIQITSECPNAIFIHCFCHSLNLAAQNCSK